MLFSILVRVNLVMWITGTGLWLLITGLRDPGSVSPACLASGWEGPESPCGHNPLSPVCVCLCACPVNSLVL